MDNELFIENLKKYGLNQVVKDYKEQIQEKVQPTDNLLLKNLKEYYKDADIIEKEKTIGYIEDIISNGILIVLGLIDNTSDIGQKGEFKLYYEEEGKEPRLINNKDEEDDLLTLWYEDDED
ncbi:hypothetical protein [Aquimarina longa]|uniref:hypothetical protein n=1 Tax=Aquimarina longa TaxID=1080221 RepID=UPI0007806392|nr:hypothetical protein [Aquimarina longa]